MGVFAKQSRGGKHEEEENKYKPGSGNILRIRRNLAKFSANATGLAERTFLKKKNKYIQWEKIYHLSDPFFSTGFTFSLGFFKYISS